MATRYSIRLTVNDIEHLIDCMREDIRQAERRTIDAARANDAIVYAINVGSIRYSERLIERLVNRLNLIAGKEKNR